MAVLLSAMILHLLFALRIQAAEPLRVLMLAGEPSHGYGMHEHAAGLRVLADSLRHASRRITTEIIQGWPSHIESVQNADAVVIYCDGKENHLAFEASKRHQIAEVLTSGGGLVAIHYATEMLNDESGDHWRDLLGGHFETNYSVNPHWVAEFESFETHPSNHGLEPFRIKDEWYFNMRFSKKGKLTPVLRAIAPESTMSRPDGDHSGNPFARKSVAAGELQTVAWAFEPDIGGRSFGFTGGHNHWNWSDRNQILLLTNAIRWAAGEEIESSGATALTPAIESLIKSQDEPIPADFHISHVKQQYRFDNQAEESDDAQFNPIQHAMSPVLASDKNASINMHLEFEWPPAGLFLKANRRLNCLGQAISTHKNGRSSPANGDRSEQRYKRFGCVASVD